jgi:hypothetical protein
MAKQPVSVTLEADNVLWLRAQVQAGRGSNVSQILDRLVTEARASGRTLTSSSRSIAGTIDLSGFDPAAANREVRSLFRGASLVRQRRPAWGRKTRKRRG